MRVSKLTENDSHDRLRLRVGRSIGWETLWQTTEPRWSRLWKFRTRAEAAHVIAMGAVSLVSIDCVQV
jgi:hypothetical protein